MRRKPYYCDDGEIAYPIDHWQDVAAEQQKIVVVELQKREKGGEYMWCDIDADFCLPVESCGNRCGNYDPCNGKNGRCRELKAGLIGTGIKYQVFPDGKVRDGELCRLQ